MGGEGALTVGDVIVLQGRLSKTALGLLFLLESDWPASRRQKHRNLSLLATARDDESTIRRMLEQDFVSRYYSSDTPKTPDDILICSPPQGYVKPGEILQCIEEEFVKARSNGYSIDRVMVNDIAHWEMSCPFLRDDETFGDTLVDFLRRHGVTSLLACEEFSQETPATVQRPIISSADCVIKFEWFEFRGSRRILMNVVKTRSMTHRREAYEITFDAKGLEVSPTASLLRVEQSGSVKYVKIRLFLHAESDMQQEYNETFLDGVKAILLPETEIGSQDRVYINRAMNLGPSSAVDELQLFQLDEFQVPNLSDSEDQDLTLYRFSAALWDKEE